VNDKQLTWEQAVEWLREQPDQADLVRHCYYDDPIQEAAERFSLSQEWNAVARILKKYLPGKVLDLGAGRGISSYAFAKHGCHVVALEPETSDIVGTGAIQLLINETQLPIVLSKHHAEKLPFPDNSFDIVYGRAVLHHTKDLSMLCHEVKRVLKPRGVFLATREHVISRHEDLQQFLDSHSLHYLYGGENAFLLNEYISAIDSADMKLKTLLGPFDSVINFAPTTHEQFRTQLSVSLKVYFGHKISFWFSQFEIIQKVYGRWLSEHSDEPGRHYSFLATKA